MVRKRWLALVCHGALLTIAASADAAMTIGPDPLPPRTGVVSSGGARIFTTNALPGVVLSSPIDGVVVRWRARRGSGPGSLPADTITLRILRGTGTTYEFTAVGTSEPHEVPAGSSDPVGVHEFATRLPIAAGDAIGLGTSVAEVPYGKTPGASYLVRTNALADGETATFTPGAFPELYVLVNADIEPDCDGDGFGDETQDATIPEIPGCPSTPSQDSTATAADTTAPDARIDRGPRKRLRTRRRRATVRFRFSSNEAGARFECKLDKRPYRPCSSPKRYRVRTTRRFRKHRFRVRAIDESGNVDPTPAKRSFRVKRLGGAA